MQSPIHITPSRRYQQQMLSPGRHIRTPAKLFNDDMDSMSQLSTPTMQYVQSPTTPSSASVLTPLSPNTIQMDCMQSPDNVVFANKAYRTLVGTPVTTTSTSSGIYTPSYYKRMNNRSPQQNVVMSRKAHKLLVGGLSPQRTRLSPGRHSPSRRHSPRRSSPYSHRSGFNAREELANSNRRKTVFESGLKRASSEGDAKFFKEPTSRIQSINPLKSNLHKSNSIGNLKKPSSLQVPEEELHTRKSKTPKHGLIQRVKQLKKKSSKKKNRLSDSSRLALAQDIFGAEVHVRGKSSRPNSPIRSPAKIRVLVDGTFSDDASQLIHIPSLNIGAVLTNEHYNSVFHDFCKQERSTENIDFWNEVTRYDQWASRRNRLSHAKQIFDNYVSPNGPNALNIDLHAVNYIRQKIIAAESAQIGSSEAEDALIGLFQPVRTSIEVCMNDTLHRFKASQSYRSMLKVGSNSTTAAAENNTNSGGGCTVQ
jgi:hypothetical protein